MSQSAIGICLGFAPPTPAANSTTALATSTSMVAFSFVAQATGSLTQITFHIAAKNGTGASVTVNAYSDASGAPNIGGGSLGTFTVGTITANSQVTATHSGIAVTQGTKYWVVLTNPTSDGTNNFSVVGALANSDESNVSLFSGAKSANTGSTWTQLAGLGMRFGFADGSYAGAPMTSIAFAGTTQGVNSTNQLGVRFTTPANTKYKVAGLGFYLNVSGTPTGNAVFNLYDSSHTLLAATDAIPNSTVIGISPTWFVRNFSSAYGPQTLQPATTYTVAISETTQSDTAANRITAPLYTWDSDANSLPLIPWSAELDYYNGSAWSPTNNIILPFSLVLATGGEFVSSGGGGLFTNSFSGGML